MSTAQETEDGVYMPQDTEDEEVYLLEETENEVFIPHPETTTTPQQNYSLQYILAAPEQSPQQSLIEQEQSQFERQPEPQLSHNQLESPEDSPQQSPVQLQSPEPETLEELNDVAINTIPMPIQASKMRQAMLNKASRTFDVITKAVNDIVAQNTPLSSAHNIFFEFLKTVIPTLNQDQLSEFVDRVIAAYVHVKNI